MPANEATLYDKWKKQVEADLKGADFNEKLVSHFDGIEIRPLYTADDLPEFTDDESAEFLDELNEEFEVELEAHGASLVTWNICEEIQSDEFLNDIVYASLRRGASYLRMHTADWDKFFNDIRKINYQCTFTLHVDSDLTEENIVNIWRERVGFIGNRDLLISGIEFDPISHFVQHGIQHEAKTFNNLSQLFFRLTPHLHDCRLVKVDTSILQIKSPAEQIATALSICSDYFDQLSEREVPLIELIHLMVFRFETGDDYFGEIAKLRAFKNCWMNFVKAFIEDAEYVPPPHIQSVVTHRENADPQNELISFTTRAMSAVLGGCDTLSIIPANNENLLSTHIQNILRYESHFDQHRNAANGSFYLEHLTNEMGKHAWEMFLKMEEDGGFLNKLKIK